METYSLGYRFRIYPNSEQRSLIARINGCARFVYNHFLAVRRDEWALHKKSLSYKDTSAMLTELKQMPGTAWLKEADSRALQNALKNLDRAFQNFFAKRAKFPRFKSKKFSFQSYRTQNQKDNIRIENGGIRLPKLGFVKIKQSRAFGGRILNASVTSTASGKYFVSLTVERNKAELLKTNKGGRIGIDVGIRHFYTDSNKNTVGNPRTLKKFLKKLRRYQRALFRRKPGSANRMKARLRIARIHEKITTIRSDFLHKLTTKLAEENAFIAVENLDIRHMMKTKWMARNIGDVSWGEFFRMLEYKTELHQGKLVKVERDYPSSETCSHCGYVNEK